MGNNNEKTTTPEMEPVFVLPKELTDPNVTAEQMQLKLSNPGWNSQTYNYADSFVKELEKANKFKPQFGAEYLNKAFKEQEDLKKKIQFEGQSIGDSMGNFLAQSVGEIVGGTVEGLGYILDIPGWWNALQGDTTDWGNWFSDLGKDLNTWTEEQFPLYEDPEGEGPGNLNYWLRNGKSIVSTFTLLIPASGVAKGTSLLTRNLGLSGSRKIAELAKSAGASEAVVSKIPAISDGLKTVAFSRHAENMMEASQIYDEQYNKYITSVDPQTGQNFTDDRAKELAAKAAHRTYIGNWAMVAQDLMHYNFILKGSKYWDEISNVQKTLGKTAKGEKMSSRWGAISQHFGEGGEEAFQFITGEESKYFSDLEAGLTDKKSASERMKDYFKDGDLYTAAMFGALGSAAMTPLMKRYEKKMSEYYSNKRFEAAVRNDFAGVKAIEAEKENNWLLGQLKNGTVDQYTDELNSLLENPNIDPEARRNILEHLESVDKYKNYYTALATQHGEGTAFKVVQSELGIKLNDKVAQESDRLYNESLDKLPLYSDLSDKGKDILNKTVEVNSLKQAIEVAKKGKESNAFSFSDKSINVLEQKLSDAQAKLAEAESVEYEDNQKKLDDNRILSAYRKADYRNLNSLKSRKALSEAKKADLLDERSSYLTEETVQEEVNNNFEKAKEEEVQDNQEFNDYNEVEFKTALYSRPIDSYEDGIDLINDIDGDIKAEKSKPKGQRNNALVRALEDLKAGKLKRIKVLEKEKVRNHSALLDIANKIVKGETDFTPEQLILRKNNEDELGRMVEALKNSAETKANKEFSEKDKQEEEDKNELEKSSIISEDPDDIEDIAEHLNKEVGDNSINSLSDLTIVPPPTPEQIDASTKELDKIAGERKEVVESEEIFISEEELPSPDEQQLVLDYTTQPADIQYVESKLSNAASSSSNPFDFEVDADGKVLKVNGQSVVARNADGSPVLTDMWDEINFTVRNSLGFLKPGMQVKLSVWADSNNDDIITRISKFNDPNFWKFLPIKIEAFTEGKWITIDQLRDFKDNGALTEDQTELTAIRKHLADNWLNGRKTGFNYTINDITIPFPNRERKGLEPVYKPAIQVFRPILNDIRLVAGKADGTLKGTTEPLFAPHVGGVYIQVPSGNNYFLQTVKLRTLNEDEIQRVIDLAADLDSNYSDTIKKINEIVYTDKGKITFNGFSLKYPSDAVQIADHIKQLRSFLELSYRRIDYNTINTEGKYTDPVSGIEYNNYNEFVLTDVVSVDLDINMPYYNGVIMLDNKASDIKDIIETKTEQEKTAKKTKGKKGPDDFTGAFKKGTIVGESNDKAIAFIKSRLPQFEVQDIQSLFNLHSNMFVKDHDILGAFFNNIIYLRENAGGTGYHEAFHAVFRSLLDRGQRNILISEASTKYKLDKNRVQDLIDIYPNADDSQILALYYEEQMADDFMDRMLAEEEFNEESFISRFFKKLARMVASIFNKRSQIESVFKNIKNGYYADINSVGTLEDPAFKIAGMNYYEVDRRTESLFYKVATAMNRLLPLEGNKAILDKYSNKPITSFTDISIGTLNDAFDQIKAEYQKDLDSGNYAGEIKKIMDNWEDLKLLTKRKLATLGFRVNTDLLLDAGVIEEASEDTKERVFDKPFYTEDPKETLSSEMRMYMAFIPKLTKDNDTINWENADDNFGTSYVLDDIEDFVFEDTNKMFKYIKSNLTGLNGIEEMIPKLKELAEIQPSLVKVVNDLERSELGNKRFVKQFKTAFTSQPLYFITVLEGGSLDDKNFSVIETNREKLEDDIINEWREYNKRDILTFKDGKYSIDKNKASQIDRALNRWIQVNGKKLEFTYQDAKILHDIAAGIGIYISTDVLHAKLNSDRNFIREYVVDLGGENVQTLKLLTAQMNTNNWDIFSANQNLDGELTATKEKTILSKLAKLEAEARIDGVVDSFRDGSGNTVYSLNMNTALSIQLAPFFNPETFQQKIEETLSDPYVSLTGKVGEVMPLLFRHLLDNPRDVNGMRISVFDTARLGIKGFKGVGYDTINDVNWLKTLLNSYMNSTAEKTTYFAMPVPADKGNIYFVKGPKFKATLNNSGNVTGDSYKELYKLFLRELNSIRKWHNEMETLAPKDRIAIFHSKKAGSKFHIFTELNDVFYKEGKFIDPTLVGDNIIADEETRTQVEKIITEFFKDKVDSITAKASEYGLVDEQFQIKELDGKFKAGFRQEVANFVYNWMMYTDSINVGTINSPAYFGDAVKTTKRFGLWQTPGSELDRKLTTRIAVANDIEGDPKSTSEYQQGLRDTVDSLKAVLEKDSTVANLNNLLTPYLKVNSTDAQGYTSLSRHLEILREQGKDKKFIESLDKIEKGLATEEDFKIVFQPIKGLFTGYRKHAQTGRMVPVIVKYSTVPLLPIVTKNFPKLDNLRQWMDDSKVHETVFTSAFKSGYGIAGDITNPETLADTVVEVSSAHYRIPQVIPYKEKGKVLQSAQMIRNILANIQDDYSYSLDNKSGREMIDHLDNLLESNVFDDAEDLDIRLGKDLWDKLNYLTGQLYEETDESFVEDTKQEIIAVKKEIADKIRKLFAGEYIKRNNVPSIYMEALEVMEDGEFAMPLDFPILTKKYENLFLSVFHNKVIKKQLPGFMGVNVSDFGYQEETKNNITVYQGYNNELDNRKYNYFTVDKSEAKNYGSKIKEVDLSTSDLLNAKKDKEKYYSLRDEFKSKTNKTYDVLDNSEEGLKTQEEFFAFLETKGIKGINYTDYSDTRYIITFGKIPLAKTSDLKYIQPTAEANGYAECYVSQDYFKGMFGRSISEEEFNNLPEKLKHVVAYRTPNQGKNSVVALKIKGLLPKEIGSQIIGPKQLTTQLGLDFDIDKLTILIKHFNVKGGNVSVVEYNSNTSEEATKERFDSYIASPEGVLKAARYLSNKDMYLEDLKMLSEFIDNAKRLESDPNASEWQKEEATNKLDSLFGQLKNLKSAIKEEFYPVFSSWSVEKQNTRKARENRIIEAIESIMNNPKHLKDIVQPNSVATLESIVKDYQLKTKKDASYYDINYHLEQRRLNQAGKQLVGTYSIHQAALSMMQIIKPISAGIDFLFTDNNKDYKYDTLGRIYDSSGMMITNNMAELQNAALDNAKEPILGYLNDNMFVAGIRGCMTAFGVPLKVSSLFLAQPVIKEFNDLYTNKGSSRKASAEALNILKKKYYNAVFEATGSQPDMTVDALSAEELKTNLINSRKENPTVSNEFQLKVLIAFEKYSIDADEYAKAIRALRVDSTTVGIPSTIQEATKLRNDVLSQIEVPSSVDISSVYSNFSPAKHLKAYFEKGVLNALNYADKLFIVNSPLFESVRSEVVNELQLDSLSSDQIGKINFNFYTFLFTSPDSPLFRMRDEVRSMFIGSQAFSNKLIAHIKSQNTKYAGNTDMINPVLRKVKFVDTKDGVTLIRMNLNGLSTLEKDALSEALYDLYQSPETKELVENWISYQFYQSGFETDPTSLFNIVPAAVWQEMGVVDYYKYLRGRLDRGDYPATDLFIHQFIAHNAADDLLVPRISTKNDTGLTVGNNGVLIMDATHGLVKTIKTKDGKARNVYPNYVKEYNRKKKSTYLYTLTSNDGATATYELLNVASFNQYSMEQPFTESFIARDNNTSNRSIPNKLGKLKPNVEEFPSLISEDEDDNMAMQILAAEWKKEQGNQEVLPEENQYDQSTEFNKESTESAVYNNILNHSKFQLSNTIKNFLEKFYSSQGEDVVQPYAEKLTNADKELLAASIGKKYKDITAFDWYEELWSNVGSSSVYYYLMTGNTIHTDSIKKVQESPLYKQAKKFNEESKSFLEAYKEFPKEIQKEQKKDYDKVLEKGRWYHIELMNLRDKIEEDLLTNLGFYDKTISVDPVSDLWKNYEVRIGKKFPDLTFEEFASFTDEERNNLIECL